jgi:tetrahydromethanopterin S-methyltransferase subunit F
MLSRRFVISALIVLVLAFIILSMPSAVFAETTRTEAQSAIAAAQKQLTVCYRAVANASSAGANVTALNFVLDQAGGNLSLADLAYGADNFSSAQSYAVQSLNLLVQNNVTARADALESSASQAGFWGFMIGFVGSAVGAFAVVVGGFVVWGFLKRRYLRVGGAVR